MKILTTLIICMILVWPAQVIAYQEPLVRNAEVQTFSHGSFARVTPIDDVQESSLTVPLLQSNAFTDISTQGNDGFENVRKAEDTTHLSVTVRDDGNGIDTTQVWFGTSRPFDSCDLVDDGYVCGVTIPASGSNVLESKKYSYTAYYYTDTYLASLGEASPSVTEAVAQRRGAIYVDNRAPIIDSFSVPARVGATLPITYSFLLATRQHSE